ncbi:hypothetical protein [Dactylosporangium sp. NPDC051541]|uniref:hypothetical protein n=1 Tax=Dactylosporangium sp. NPDC051541 TaxID=3363977 RepID=UPI0037B0E50C
MLRGPQPDEQDARLDAHERILKAHLDRIASALTAFPDFATAGQSPLTPAPALASSGLPRTLAVVPFGRFREADTTSTGRFHPAFALDEALDSLANWLLDRFGSWPDQARELAVATARLVEDGEVLQAHARRQRPLGKGFESLRDERLRRRFALLPERASWLTTLSQLLPLLMEEPDEGAAQFEREVGVTLPPIDRAWLECERRVAMLRFVRHRKTENGHIRWFLRNDENQGVILDRFGVSGHWIVSGIGRQDELTRLATAVERTLSANSSAKTPSEGWRLVTVNAGEPALLAQGSMLVASSHVLPAALSAERSMTSLRAQVRRNLSMSLAGAPPSSEDPSTLPTDQSEPLSLAAYALRADPDGVALVAARTDSSLSTTVARVGHQADDDQMLSFLDSVECVADSMTLSDEIAEEFRESPSAQWSRALLRLLRDASVRPRGRRVRLVYVPSAIQHQLGGVPLIGLEFLRDRLERIGNRVNVLVLPPESFERRLPELLGAEVIGIGVYIHNIDEVSSLIRLLRSAGFVGKVVLGGPQMRDVDRIQATIDGWDALIRGEAEEVLPQVLRVLELLDAGRWQEALDSARTFTGVAIRHGRTVLLCDTAGRNRVGTFACPLPFDWRRGKSERRVQMNFSRGCPYLCTFCPNHQGQMFRAGPVEELWQYTVLAVADDMPLPLEVEHRTARLIQDHLGVSSAERLRLAVYVLSRTGCEVRQLRQWLMPLCEFADPKTLHDPIMLQDLIGCAETLESQLSAAGTAPMSSWQIKRSWLLARIAVLASRQLWRRTGERCDLLDRLALSSRSPFVLATSEDNTLVNRSTVREYLARRIRYGLDGDVVFNPGQNTVFDLSDSRGGADEDYIGLLVDHNPFAVALGADGASNPVIRQNRKPRYQVNEVLAVNRALAGHGVEVANNYILITPETDLLEAVEAFLLFVMLPIPWRDYGDSINLRVIKEEGTLAHDEGLLFAPEDTGWYEPMRFVEVDALLKRWSLSSEVSARDINTLLWRILETDEEVTPLLPDVVERWVRNYDDDAELALLGRAISVRVHQGVPLSETLRAVRDDLVADFAGARPVPGARR